MPLLKPTKRGFKILRPTPEVWSVDDSDWDAKYVAMLEIARKALNYKLQPEDVQKEN